MKQRVEQPALHGNEMPLPGPLYPDRCLLCQELTRETYGGVIPLRCAECVAAARRKMKARAQDG